MQQAGRENQQAAQQVGGEPGGQRVREVGRGRFRSDRDRAGEAGEQRDPAGDEADARVHGAREKEVLPSRLTQVSGQRAVTERAQHSEQHDAEQPRLLVLPARPYQALATLDWQH